MSDIVKHGHFSRDRVTVSWTRKYNIAKFESVDLHIGLSSDKKADETIEEAFDRVEKTTQEEFEKLCLHVEKKHKI